MHITKLTIENFMRVKLIEIVPDGNAIIISGKNGQGKSSVLDSFFAALQSSEASKIIQKPIRDGESKASVVVELGDITVTRTWTDKGTYLKVESKDGAVYKSPQAMLDALVGKLSFDPLAFTTYDEKEQLKVLMSLVKLPKDPVQFEEEKQIIYNERTLLNREIRNLQGAVALMTPPSSELPEDEITSMDIIAEIQEAQKVNYDNAEKRKKLQTISSEILNADVEILYIQDQISDLISQKEFWEEKTKNMREYLTRLQPEVASLKDIDVREIHKKLASVELTNVKIRAAKKFKEVANNIKEREKVAGVLTADIAKIEEEKNNMLSSVQMPVKGLTFDSERIYYNNIPFSQCAKSEQLRVSLGILIKSNPKLKVVRFMNGSFNLLDDNNKKVVLEVMNKNGMQCWIEDAFDGKEGKGIIIEDGEIKNAN